MIIVVIKICNNTVILLLLSAACKPEVKASPGTKSIPCTTRGNY